MLYMPIGPPGCGKSTLAERMSLAGLITPDAIVSADHYRYVLTGDQTNQNATLEAFKLVGQITRYRLKAGLDVFLDATNLTAKERDFTISDAIRLGQEVTLMPTTLSEEKIRKNNADTYREQKGTIVPDTVMQRMFSRLENLSLANWETHAQVTVTPIEEMSEFCEDLLFDRDYT